jgi:hypothetical protein
LAVKSWLSGDKGQADSVFFSANNKQPAISFKHFAIFARVKIDKHISELLYRYDCVIVPDLGGFVCNYSPARIHPVQNSFSPPSKHIVFNSNLRNNDGLLANHISQEENKTFREANGIINAFVVEADKSLRAGNKVAIEEVGTLFLDVERNVQFEPEGEINFLLDSFGLDTFRSPAIKREGVTKRIEKEFKDRIIPIEKAADRDNVKKRRVNVRRMVALAIAAPLIAAMIWIPLKTDLLSNVNFASLNPFAKKELPLYKYNATVVPALTEKDLADNSANELKDKTSGSVDMKLFDDAARTIIVSIPDVNVTVPESTSVKPVENNHVMHITRGNYYIIGGCFEIYSNATRFVATLKSKGYDAAILSEGLGRLHPVCYTSFATREDALAELSRIHSEDPNAWLLSR